MTQEFDASLESGAHDADHHLCTIRFLGKGGVVRQGIEDFVAGLPLAGTAKEAVAQLAFVPLAERIVESLHAAVKQASHERQVSGTFVSMAFRDSVSVGVGGGLGVALVAGVVLDV